MDIPKDILASSTSVILLNSLQTKQITLEEFSRDCAYWALQEGFDDLRPRPLPSRPNTPAFNEYEMLPPLKKLKVDFQFFTRNTEINEYYAQANMIRAKNKAVYLWLKEIRGYLPQEDDPLRAKIDTRLQEFDNWLNAENDLVDKAREVFEGELTNA